jgi:ABC-type nitrate/sulfonate/bicarbonate transport system substrate-binding protein
MTQRLRLVSLTLVLFVVLVAVVFLAWPKPRTERVRIGYLPIYVDLPVFVAQEGGIFHQYGIEVELKRFESSPDIGTALLTKDVEFGASIAYSVVLSTESRDPGRFRVFLVDSEDSVNYLSSIVIPKGSPIRNVADLRGKKIGFFPGPTAKVFGSMVLEKFGINPANDVTVIELAVDTHLSALETGLVDALFTYEPTATQAVMDKGAVKLVPGAVESHIISPWQAGVWVVSTQFAASNPEIVQRVIRALYEAVDTIRANPNRAKSFLTKYTSIRTDVALNTPTIPFAKLQEVDLAAFQRHADILRDRGVISRTINAGALLIPDSWIRVP